MAPTAAKRRIDFVDLTQDDDIQDENVAPTNSHAQKQARTSHLPTPPTSSQPHPSSSIIGDPEDRSTWSTQGDADEEVTGDDYFDDNAYQRLCLYGVLSTKIVGVRYYRGRATMGEFVLIKREPRNPYDSNAIRIDNVMGDQIGHIPRTVASKLARFMDSGSLILEGKLTGPKGEFDMPLDLKLFGTSDPQQQTYLKEEMKKVRLPISGLVEAERERKKAEQEAKKQRAQEVRRILEQERRRKAKDAADAASRAGMLTGSGRQFENENESQGFANLSQPDSSLSAEESVPSIEDIINSSTSFNPRELGEVVDKYGSTEDQLSQLPLADQPASLATKLLPYQRQGLAWMLDRESPVLPPPGSKDSIQLWKRSTYGFTNIATNYTISEPKLASGGILADDMGLGKTIQVISLLMADPKRNKKQPTLIVSPLSVMSNWSGQIETHVKADKALRVLTYHGSGRKSQTAAEFERFDVVITTYETMALEYLPGGSKTPKAVPRANGLFSVKWRRIVLDEGHGIRNPKAKKALAAYALASMSQSNWVLTGTPIVNNLKDLQSHVRFIGLTGGLEKADVFAATVIRPLNQGMPEAAVLLRALIGTLCLRRMKDMKFVDLRLPTLSSHKYSVSWLKHEREKYEAFQAEAKGLLKQVQTRKNQKGENVYSNLLEVLLRLRQTCNHWKLCGDRIKNLMAALEQGETVTLNTENKKALQDLLQVSIDSQEECPVCMETLHNPVITSCAHAFGAECIERVIETQHKCPMCRAELVDNTALVKPAADMGESEEPDIDIETSSSKVEALMNLLKASRKKQGIKTVVFSQWTSFLDVIQHQLADNSFNYTRLDGKMNAAQRDAAMKSLEHDPNCTILLASLSVCSVGLNLCAASQVILSDSWWSPMIEDQAVDRVYRLGQTKPVNVFRLVMEDSIEERVIEIQQEKRKLMMTAFGERTMKRGNEKAARLADIEKLLK